MFKLSYIICYNTHFIPWTLVITHFYKYKIYSQWSSSYLHHRQLYFTVSYWKIQI